MEIDYIPGHNPDFVCFGEDGAELDRIDLTGLDLQAMHDLVQAHGFSVPMPDKNDAEDSDDLAEDGAPHSEL